MNNKFIYSVDDILKMLAFTTIGTSAVEKILELIEAAQSVADNNPWDFPRLEEALAEIRKAPTK